MRNVALAFVVLVAPSVVLADESPCSRAPGAQHESVLTRVQLSELDLQKQCLAWEYAVLPKAEFIPPAARPRIDRTTRIRPGVPPPQQTESFLDRVARDLRLKPERADPFPPLSLDE